jgi:hypothetical protein
LLREIRVKEFYCEKKIRLVYPARRALSHAAKAFLEVVRSGMSQQTPAKQPVPAGSND